MALLNAILYNKKKQVEDLLRGGEDANQEILDGMTPLYVAASKGFAEIANILLVAGANVNKTTKGFTPLYVAADEGYKNVVQLLLAAGADVNIVVNDDETPLYAASQNGHADVAQLLIAAGADINKPSIYGDSPLYAASQDGHANVARVLLAAGADMNKTYPDDGTTPLYIAAYNGHEEVVRVLIAAGADINKPSNDGESPLFAATIKGKHGTVKILIAAGADVNQSIADGTSLLLVAANSGFTEIVKLLLAEGADVHQITTGGKSVVQLAESNKFKPKIKKLILDSLEKKKWEGFTRSDIAKFDSIFETEGEAGGRPPAENSSTCPVCLQYVFRGEACKYMKHKCDAGPYHHEQLYHMYKNDLGEISWCTICGRICSGHRHYRLSPHSTKAQLAPIETGVNFFSDSCKGGEGGGGLEEKFLRFRRLREYAMALQEEVGKKDFDEAMDELVEETWNAPLARVPTRALEKMKTTKKFNINTAGFTANVAPVVSKVDEVNAPNVVREGSNNADLKPIAVEVGTALNDFTAENTLGGSDDGLVIYFRHKDLHGRLVDHKARQEGIGIELLQEYVGSQAAEFGTPAFGKCPFPGCGALLYPDEIKGFVSAELYDDYRKKFNRKFATAGTGAGAGMAPAAGGKRQTRSLKHRKQRGGGSDVFIEMKNPECVVIPKTGGRRKTYRRSTKQRRNTRRIL